MWIKTYTGDLFTSDYFCAIFLTGPYATNAEAQVQEEEDRAYVARQLNSNPDYQGDGFDDPSPEEKAPDQTLMTLWAIVGEPKTPEGYPGQVRHVLLGYGPQGVANALRIEIGNGICDKAEIIDAAEVLAHAGYTIPASEDDQIAIAARGELFPGEKLNLFNPR